MKTDLNQTGDDTLCDFLPVGICIIDPEYNVLSWNKCLENWSGLKTDDMIGSDLRDKCEKLKSKHFMRRFTLLFRGGPPDNFSSQLHEYLIPSRLHNGEMRIQHTTAIALRTEVAGRYNAMIICEDVTNLVNEVRAFRFMRDRAVTELEERVKTENALRIVNTKLPLMNSITRHDILNQLTVAIMSLQLIDLDEVIPQDSKPYEHFRKIASALESIRLQINFTKDYQEMGVKSPEWQDFGGIIDRTNRISFKELEVKNELMGCEIYADPLFEKVIYTLFDNAVRHGERVTEINFSFSEDEKGNINIIYEDNGRGIAEDEKERIFDRGYGNNTGLGLFLSLEILSITGISIIENGVPGKGARFVICVPKEMFKQPESE